MWRWVWVLGAEPTPTPAAPGIPDGSSVTSYLAYYGPIGLCLLLVVAGWLNPKGVTDRLDSALIRVEKQRDDLVAQMAEVIPVLIRVQDVLLPAAQNMSRELSVQSEEIKRLTEEIKRLREETRDARGRDRGRDHGRGDV